MGNGNGWAGVGDAQSGYSAKDARTKAILDAMKHMFFIERYRNMVRNTPSVRRKNPHDDWRWGNVRR